MTIPAVSFGDPQSETRLVCVALLPDAPEAIAGVKISTRLPEARPDGLLLVVRAGTWAQYEYPVAAKNRVRAVAYGRDEDAVLDVANWFHGKLRAFRGSDSVRGYGIDTPPAKGTDPDFGIPIAAFTLLCSMRPAIL